MPNGDHAAAAGNFLTRKIGPLPAWAYGVAAAVLVGVVVLYQRGRTSTAAASAAQASSPYASSAQGQLNYPPTVVVTPGGIGNTVSTPSTPGAPKSSVGTASGSPTGIFTTPGSTQLVTTVPPGTQLTLAGPPVKGETWGNSAYWQPVNYGGLTGYVSSLLISLPSGQGGDDGMGGQSRRGGPSATLITHNHAGMGGPWGHFSPFQPHQYVNTGRGGDGLGGGDGMGGGHGAIAAIARKTGISEHRLQSLNSHLRRPDGTYGRGIVRIA